MARLSSLMGTNEPEDLETADPAESDDPRVKRMGFLEHLEELRWTIIKCLVTFMVVVILIAAFLKQFMFVLNWPLEMVKPEYPTLKVDLVTISPMAVFSVAIQACFLGGFIISLPFFLIFIGQFILPALHPREVKLLLPTAVAALFLFLFGAVFSYLLLVPGTIRVSLELNELLGFQTIWTADKYYWLLVVLVLGMGAAFEFPLVILLLVYLGIVDVAKLRRARRLMIIVFFVIAAIITPTPDPINQSIVALTMIALYELSILVAIWIGKRRPENAA